jgi:hypothetical protein
MFLVSSSADMSVDVLADTSALRLQGRGNRSVCISGRQWGILSYHQPAKLFVDSEGKRWVD